MGMSLFSSVFDFLWSAARHHITLKKLRKLSDDQLFDIGLSRSQLRYCTRAKSKKSE
jgi:uncharacterized protein YjiS (DUF1127 family)